MRSKRNFYFIALLCLLLFNSCKKSDDSLSKALSQLQNKWILTSRTMFSTDPLPSDTFPGIYDRYVGTPTDSYTFTSDGLAAITQYGISSTLKYALINTTTIAYSPYNSFTWPPGDNPIIIKILTDNLLVLSYPTYGHFTANMISLDYTGVRIDSLKR